MAESLIAPMAGNLDFGGGYTIRFDAEDPATGATIANVSVTEVSVFATDLAGGAADQFGPFQLVAGPQA